MPLAEARATVAITVATVIVSLVVLVTGSLPEAAVGGGFIPLRLDPALTSHVHSFPVPAWVTPLTATLLHGGIAHLLLNLMMLVFCGVATERAIGPVGVGVLYLAGAYGAAAGQYLLEPSSPVPMVGASGAISALVGAYALLYGTRRARPLGPIPGDVVHVAWLAAAWIGIQLMVGLAGVGVGAQIAIGAHIGGFAVGLALVRPLLRWRYRDA